MVNQIQLTLDVVSFPDHSHLVPRLLLSHFQTTPTLFLDGSCLIPRPLPPRSQTVPVSFPNHSHLVPRLFLSHAQTTPTSFPGLCCLIPRSPPPYPKLLLSHSHATPTLFPVLKNINFAPSLIWLPWDLECG